MIEVIHAILVGRSVDRRTVQRSEGAHFEEVERGGEKEGEGGFML